MLNASSSVGSPTCTGWKRRSKAASFSMCFLYSSNVVAPITWNVPRANAGFKILAASIAPSEAPAPTNVWISSMKIIISSCFCTSSMAFFKRSSNSPRYLAPASMALILKEIIRLLRKISGTLPVTIRCARPSAMAVLPTPGSPINTGLFLVRRLKIWITRVISVSRPMTGSILPCLADSFKSVAKSAKSPKLLLLDCPSCPHPDCAC